MTKKSHQPPAHPFLAQMLFRYLGPMPQMCQAVNHHQVSPEPLQAEWELRFYQNPDRGVDLFYQEVPEDQIAQRLWDEGCREQDTIGIIVHKRMYLCNGCTRVITQGYAGEIAAFLNMETAVITKGAFILVSDRYTENAAIVGNVPGTIQEREILPLLDQEDMLDIRFKGEAGQ